MTACRSVTRVALTALAAFTPPVQAATWCVADSASLSLALAVAGDSIEGDVLRLQAGSFSAPAAVGYQGSLVGGDLEISGGWNTGCTARTPGARSTIQGQDIRPGLALNGQPPQRSRLRIAHMGFNRGAGQETGGLSINNNGSVPVDVEIEDSRFTNNVLGPVNEYVGGGLWLNVRDNEGRDLSFSSSSVYLRKNNLGSYAGTPAPGSSGNVNLDPQFLSAANLQLRRSSPMVDNGLAAPLQGLPPHSHDGGPRVAAGQVDIGAYELDRLFGNGFALILIPIADAPDATSR